MDEGARRLISHELGLRINPPAVILHYTDTSTNKFRRRVMPLRGFQPNSVVGKYVADLKERHGIYLADVPNISLTKLLRILQETLRGKDLKTSKEIVEREFKVDPMEDLNKLDCHTLRVKKEIMDETFFRNQKKPGDPGYQYDVVMDFDTNQAEPSGWDDE